MAGYTRAHIHTRIRTRTKAFTHRESRQARTPAHTPAQARPPAHFCPYSRRACEDTKTLLLLSLHTLTQLTLSRYPAMKPAVPARRGENKPMAPHPCALGTAIPSLGNTIHDIVSTVVYSSIYAVISPGLLSSRASSILSLLSSQGSTCCRKRRC